MPASAADGPLLLKKWLDDRDMTQLAFAALSGIPQSDISAYVNDKRRPDLTRAFLIQGATEGGVPASSWIRRDASATPAESVPVKTASNG